LASSAVIEPLSVPPIDVLVVVLVGSPVLGAFVIDVSVPVAAVDAPLPVRPPP
jgi:hypothetical protein